MIRLPLFHRDRWARQVLGGHPMWFPRSDGVQWYIYNGVLARQPIGVGPDLCTALLNALAHEGIGGLGA